MILGIGTDLTSIDRIRQVLADHGDRFIARCFAPEEHEYVEEKASEKPHLAAGGYAKRWAAKEACAKALGMGIRGDIYLRDIIITNDSEGKPSLTLQGGAKDRLTRMTPEGMTPVIHLSLTDEPPMALAFVVISAVAKTA